MTYIATFYSHYGAIQFRKNCEKMKLDAVIMPVPRNLSSSCGTCVRFEAEGEFPEKNEETGEEEVYSNSAYRMEDLEANHIMMADNSLLDEVYRL